MITADKKFLAEIDAKAEALKDKIMNSEDTIPHTGTVYYFSNRGCDSNDGLSPETAVQSLERFYSLPLKEGDTVLFERGGLWRGELYVNVKNITIAAYGKGEKPRFYGSLKNYAVPHEWVKTDRPNIWRYVKPFDIDIGHIICDGGKVHCIKKCLGHHGFGGTLDEVKNDLEFWCDRDDRNTLYFCSEKNPGERFFEMELHRRISFFILKSGQGARLDNLCIKYVGVHGISCGTFNDLHVTNCEIGYIGGGIQFTRDERDTRLGNGVEIYGACKDYSVENCYIHDCYDAGITHQFHSPMSNAMYNIKYTNNVILDCAYSVEYFNSDRNPPEGVVYDGKSYEISGNIMRRAGNSWGRPCDKASSHLKGWTSENKYADRSFTVKGNIFDRAYGYMIQTPALEESWLPVFSDNVYIQTPDGMLGYYDSYTEIYSFDENVDKIIGEKLGDKTARIYFVPEQKI